MLKAFLLFSGCFFVAMLLNFYAAPKQAVKKRAQESLLVAVLWLGASAVFLVYARFGNKEQLYGALSLLIVFFLYLYWMMIYRVLSLSVLDDDLSCSGARPRQKWGIDKSQKGE